MTVSRQVWERLALAIDPTLSRLPNFCVQNSTLVPSRSLRREPLAEAPSEQLASFHWDRVEVVRCQLISGCWLTWLGGLGGLRHNEPNFLPKRLSHGQRWAISWIFRRLRSCRINNLCRQ